MSKSVHRIVFLILLVSAFGLAWAIQPGSDYAAQDSQVVGAVPPPGPEGVVQAGVWGGLRVLGIEEGLQRKVVTGAPYSAQAVTERTQVLADGNKIDQKTAANVYRDTQGRTRRDVTMGAIGPWGTPKDVSPLVVINDPVAGVGYVLNPSKQVAVKHPLGAFKGALGKAQTLLRFDGAASLEGPVTVAGVGGVGVSVDGQQAKPQPANANTASESLGNKTIAGVEAEGTRTTVTIPAGQIGNAQAIEIVSEKWYSPALQVVVTETRNDPRFGQTTYQLTNVNLGEPDPSLFQVPSNYTIQDKPTLRHGPPPPPPDGN